MLQQSIREIFKSRWVAKRCGSEPIYGHELMVANRCQNPKNGRERRSRIEEVANRLLSSTPSHLHKFCPAPLCTPEHFACAPLPLPERSILQLCSTCMNSFYEFAIQFIFEFSWWTAKSEFWFPFHLSNISEKCWTAAKKEDYTRKIISF